MSDPSSPPTEPPRDGGIGAEPGAAGAELAPGARVGGYRIVRLIGRGGMGEVYEGWDERLARRVALKRIPVAQGAQAESRARFWREARTLAALRHPGIVTIYEIGEDPRDQSLFIAMELVVGTSLAALAARALPTGRPAGLPARLVVTLGREVALALGAAHDAKVTHRDVKPANILIEDTGQVRVIDFGLARHVDDLDHRITRSGATLGTPGYMAPEAIDGQEVGPPADVFAVGILLYRLASGVHPFERDTAQATALAIAGARFVPLHQVAPRVPTALAAAIERCLALRPTDRPADGRALAAELGAVAATLGVEPERERRALADWMRGPWDGSVAALDTQPSVSAPRVATRRKALVAVGLAGLTVASAIAWAATADPPGGSNRGEFSVADPPGGSNGGKISSADPLGGSKVGEFSPIDPPGGSNGGKISSADPLGGSKVGEFSPIDPPGGS
ncbi:MAG: serine/threonine protein kinase, partial [Deltaproteobacteria bacterium]|nr:serine/threonine protein kinase [Deltaproteobacteria bacterium]